MTIPLLDAEYKEAYLRELSRKATLNSSVSTPVGIITILLGALLYIFGKSAFPRPSSRTA